ncbi:MAG: sensor histidine kinase [Ectothiorhodospiraceae bacterium]
MALSTRVVVLVWCASGLILLAMLLTVYQLIVADYEERVAEREQSRIERLASDLDRSLQRRLLALESLTSRVVEDNRLRPQTQIKSVLDRPMLADELFPDGLLVFDADATTLAESVYVPERVGTNYADRPHFQRVFETNEPVITEPFVGRRTEAPLIAFLVPILDDSERRIGIVGGILDLSTTPLLPESDATESEEATVSLVLDPNQRLFVSMEQKMEAPESLPPPGTHALVDAALEPVPTGSVISFEGRRYVVATSRLDDLDWVVVRAIPYDQAIEPARETFMQFAGIGGGIALLVGALGWFAARSLTRPLDEMTRRIDAMANDAGEFRDLRVEGSPEVRSLARAMNRLTRERRAVDRLKDDFVSTVSHELRTPLTSLYGGLKLVDAGAAGELPRRARDMVALAMRNADRLRLLISDLLDFNRLVSGRLEFDETICSMDAVVAEALTDIGPTGDARGLRFAQRVPEGVAVVADAQRLRQVLDNLLSNAVKHAPEGSWITVTVTRQAGQRLRTTVSDQGHGVPDAYADTIFQRFMQAEQGTTRAATGAGLGLAISRELVVQMGGAIGFYNDGGAHFWFELPEAGAD